MPSEHLSSHSTFPTGTFSRDWSQPARDGCLSLRTLSAASLSQLLKLSPANKRCFPRREDNKKQTSPSRGATLQL